MANIVYCHLCLREGSKKTKGPKQDGQNRLPSPINEGESMKNKGPKQDGHNKVLSPMTEGGEQEHQKVQTGWP